MSTDLDFALSLADGADEITMARFNARDLVVETKPDLTPVSDADRAVEKLLRAAVAGRGTGDGVLGEEYDEAIGTTGRRWVVDPIDGTKNFVRGVPIWSTVIGLQESDGSVSVGVVSAPALGRRWWAARGQGAWVVEPGSPAPRRLQVSAVSDLADAYVSGSSRGGWIEVGAVDRYDDLSSRVWRQRAFGDFWSHLLVAEGAVDVAPEPSLKLYDVAGVCVIVTEAGGRFTGLDGIDGPDRGNALSSNGLLHDEVLAVLAAPTSS